MIHEYRRAAWLLRTPGARLDQTLARTTAVSAGLRPLLPRSGRSDLLAGRYPWNR